MWAQGLGRSSSIKVLSPVSVKWPYSNFPPQATLCYACQRETYTMSSASCASALKGHGNGHIFPGKEERERRQQIQGGSTSADVPSFLTVFITPTNYDNWQTESSVGALIIFVRVCVCETLMSCLVAWKKNSTRTSICRTQAGQEIVRSGIRLRKQFQNGVHILCLVWHSSVHLRGPWGNSKSSQTLLHQAKNRHQFNPLVLICWMRPIRVFEIVKVEQERKQYPNICLLIDDVLR